LSLAIAGVGIAQHAVDYCTAHADRMGVGGTSAVEREAIALLAQHGEEARMVTGGHSLIPMMKLRLAPPGDLVDLQDLHGLRGIGSEPAALVFGAMINQYDMIGSELLAARCPIIRETSLQIGDPQVRYCGTLANGDPGNDMPAAMIALALGQAALAAQERITYQRVHPCPLETCGCVASMDKVNGKLTVWGTF
jgi:CO/xanthine dehydrogenase FAD-binding subunit